MDAKKALNKIMVALGFEKLMEQKRIADSDTILEAESFAEGEPVFIVAEDGMIPAPAGDYTLEDGMMISVDDNGNIVSVGSGDEQPAEVEEEVEMQEEETKPKKVVESQVTETHFDSNEEGVVEVVFGDAHKQAIIEIVKEYLASQEQEQEQEEEVVEEQQFSEDVKPLTHSPEKKVEQKQSIQFGTNRPSTVRDRVRAIINNN